MIWFKHYLSRVIPTRRKMKFVLKHYPIILYPSHYLTRDLLIHGIPLHIYHLSPLIIIAMCMHNRYTWNFEAASRIYLLPLINKLSVIASFMIDSQVLHYADIADTIHHTDAYHYVTTSSLSKFVGNTRWNVGTLIDHGSLVRCFILCLCPHGLWHNSVTVSIIIHRTYVIFTSRVAYTIVYPCIIQRYHHYECIRCATMGIRCDIERL